MSTTVPSAPVAGRLARPRSAREIAWQRGLMRVATRGVVTMALFAVAAGAGLWLYGVTHAERIYEGVEVAGVRVGGMTPAQASESLQRRFASYAQAPLTLTAGGKTFQVTPAAAGAHLDGAASAQAAFAFGRSGSRWDRSVRWARALLYGASVPPRVTVSVDQLDAQLRTIAPAVVRAPSDARIQMDATGQPALVPDVPGISFDLAASRSVVSERFTGLSSAPVALVTSIVPASVTAAALTSSLPAAQAAVGSSLVLKAGSGAWTISSSDLKRIISVPASGGMTINQEPLRAVVAGIAQDVNHPSADAGIAVGGNGKLVVVPGRSSAAVDVRATVDGIVAALRAGRHEVPLVVRSTPPRITDDQATAGVAKAESLIASGLGLTWAAGNERLGRDDLLAALVITPQPGAAEAFAFDFDRDVLASRLAPIANRINIPVVDARFRLVNDAVTLVSDAKEGRGVDFDASVAAIVDALQKGRGQAPLTVNPLPPHVTAADRDRIKLPDVLGDSATSYAESSEPRRHNVERAVALEAGWLVPPDGIFSYAENVGKVDQGNGFVTGFGIVANDAGGVTTAPVVGGGICQVSTTIFQAAFWAGLPIVERYQHPYWLNGYGQPPRGMKGLDAMVNIEDSGSLDMKFRNATGNWIAVVLTADGENVTAQIRGTNPGWQVSVDGPKISNIVAPDETMTYTDSPELPKGQELQVEHANEGFDVEIDRTVSKGGQVIDQLALKSTFASSHNTTLRGTGAGG